MNQRKSSHITILAALVTLLALSTPFLYAFSIGPATWLVVNGYVSADAKRVLTSFYTPLIALDAALPGKYRLLEWYCGLW